MSDEVEKVRAELREALAIINLLAEADPTDSGIIDWREGTDRWYRLRELVDPVLLPKSAEEIRAAFNGRGSGS